MLVKTKYKTKQREKEKVREKKALVVALLESQQLVKPMTCTSYQTQANKSQ